MPKRIVVKLRPEQKQELEGVRDQHPQPYMRERAAAVLKIAEGQVLRQVAEHGLLKRHEPETLHLWVKKYLEVGLAGWAIKPGRGRKASFSPSQPASSKSRG